MRHPKGHLNNIRQIENYYKTGNNYISWYYYAQRLLKAADILKEQTPACDDNLGESIKNADDRLIDGLLIYGPQLIILVMQLNV